MTKPLHQLGLAEIAQGLDARRFSSEELTGHLLARIEAHRELGAFLHVDGEHALAQARASDARRAQGASRGQRLTIFRRSLGDRGPVVSIADAIIVAVRPDSATIRIERASDAVSVGDLVALHR